MGNFVHNGHDTNSKIPCDAYVIIIGAMKCGTTSLFDYMSKHPSICSAVYKEAEFFSEHQSHKIKLHRYSDLWKNYDRSIHKYVLEASTGYTKYPMESGVPEKIRSAGINPKFIYIMRNPFDRIESHFNYVESGRNKRQHITDRHFINVSNYYMQLERYRKIFPTENMLLLDFDDLSDNPDKVLLKIYAFLKLPSSLPEEYQIKNPSLPISTDHRKLIQMGDRFFPEIFRDRWRKLLTHLLPEKKKRVLTPEERKYIYGELQEGMRSLHSVYHVNVDKWGFGE